MPSENELAEELIALWLEHINLWGKAQGEDYTIGRDYIHSYEVTSMVVPHPYRDECQIFRIGCDTVDELHWFSLIGVREIFDEPQWVHATAEVDTQYREFLRDGKIMKPEEMNHD
jgi:hypothetical protein